MMRRAMTKLAWALTGTLGVFQARESRAQKMGAAMPSPNGGNGISPIIGIWAHPSSSSHPACGGNCGYVRAAYVKWLESAGIRSLPIRFDATPEELKPILDGVNGLLLPGGSEDLPAGARWAIQYARDLNVEGDFFPVWGTCLGWEWMAKTFAGDFPVLTYGLDAKNLTQPLGLLPGAEDSRILSGVPLELLEKASTEPLAANAHSKGVAPENMTASGLDEVFRTVAINGDRAGRPYVSVVEAFDFPMYGLQWHPEKSQFEWGLDPDGTPHFTVNHSADAVQLSQVLASFFASEARRCDHSFQSIMEWEPKMFYNLEVYATGPSTGQNYFFPLGRREEAAISTFDTAMKF